MNKLEVTLMVFFLLLEPPIHCGFDVLPCVTIGEKKSLSSLYTTCELEFG